MNSNEIKKKVGFIFLDCNRTKIDGQYMKENKG